MRSALVVREVLKRELGCCRLQCNKCVVVCPHAAIRAKPMEAVALENAPPSFQAAPAKGLGKDMQQFTHYSIQVTPDGCTGCTYATRLPV